MRSVVPAPVVDQHLLAAVGPNPRQARTRRTRGDGIRAVVVIGWRGAADGSVARVEHVDRAVGRKVGVEGHPEQSIAVVVNLPTEVGHDRRSGVRETAELLDQPGLFSDENTAVRREAHRGGECQAVDHRRFGKPTRHRALVGRHAIVVVRGIGASVGVEADRVGQGTGLGRRGLIAADAVLVCHARSEPRDVLVKGHPAPSPPQRTRVDEVVTRPPGSAQPPVFEPVRNIVALIPVDGRVQLRRGGGDLRRGLGVGVARRDPDHDHGRRDEDEQAMLHWA